MIRSAAPSKTISLDFVTADIENRPDGSLLLIDTYDGTDHYKHFDWEEWLTFMKVTARSDPRYRICYAHNGGKWDWLSFLEWIITEDSEKWDAIETNDRIIAIMLPLGSRQKLQLRDSLYILNCSLDEAGKKYVERGKVEYSGYPQGLPIGSRPHWLWLNDRVAFHKYHEGDTELLYECIVAFAKLVHTRIAPIESLRLTLPATAMQIFRTSYLPEIITTPSDERVRSLLRLGYAGGRVECFAPGHYRGISVYDFNSLYPAVMASTPVPISGRCYWVRTFDPDACGCYEVKFTQTDRTKLPLLMVNGVGVYSGTGVYFTPELRRFQTVGKFDIIRGIRFPKTSIVFRDYVEKLYALRLSDRNGPLGNTVKLLLNSLYGKFGQRPERTKIRILTAEEIGDKLREGTPVQSMSRTNPMLCRVTEVKRAPFEHVGIAGIITSEARARLWEAFDYGVVYCDTDSIHTTGKLPFDPDTLGALKHEFSGDAVYLGKKLYALRTDSGKDKVRAKGIRVKKYADDDLGFPLTFDSLLPLLADGNLLPCAFRAASTANAVLKGTDSACVFRQRVRSIKRTA